MTENIADAIADDVLRGATAFQQLCWLAAGRLDIYRADRELSRRDRPRQSAPQRLCRSRCRRIRRGRRERRAAPRRKRHRSARWAHGRGQGQYRRRRHADAGRLARPSRRCRARCDGRRAPSRRGRGDSRQDAARRRRARHDDRKPPRRSDAASGAARLHGRRFVRRFGRRRRRRARIVRARHRHARLRAHSGEPLRHLRLEADARRDLDDAAWCAARAGSIPSASSPARCRTSRSCCRCSPRSTRTIRARAAGACRSRRRTGSPAGFAPALLPDLESIGVAAPVRCCSSARIACSATSSASIA